VQDVQSVQQGQYYDMHWIVTASSNSRKTLASYYEVELLYYYHFLVVRDGCEFLHLELRNFEVPCKKMEISPWNLNIRRASQHIHYIHEYIANSLKTMRMP
jgi:hypothetical protein